MPTNIDFNSATWGFLAEWASVRLEALRKRNDADLDPAATALVRGQIKAFKELLGLPEAVARAESTESA